MTNDDLKIMQSWPLERKVQVTQARIIEWYKSFDGGIYVSFSGGLDSTVLLDLSRRCFPDIKGVFCDTGLEYPENRNFVKKFENIDMLRPDLTFREIIENYGYPVVSKEVAKIIYYARRGSKWASNYLKGLNSNGVESHFKQRYKKWEYLLNAPFSISHRCCAQLKELPFERYERKEKIRPMIGTRASESAQRLTSWLKSGCNNFDSNRPMSKALSFWTSQDILEYLKITDIPYSPIYGDIIHNDNGELTTSGLRRSGCMFCMFGVHLEKGENRFEKMRKTHPKQYDYCINKLGCGEVLNYLEVSY